MSDNSKIEWTDATWNPITGCSVVSPGCTHCYAMKLAGTRLAHHPSRAGLTQDTKAGPAWTGAVRLNAQWLTQPLKWRRPRRVFVCAHGDLFHESVPDDWIDRVFAVMALAPQHTFQVLTKRSARMRAYLSDADLRSKRVAQAILDMMIAGVTKKIITDENYPFRDGQPDDEPRLARFPLQNVWLGVSAEDQPRADARIPDLLATPAAERFVSAEPLLGSVDLTGYLWGRASANTCPDCPRDCDCECGAYPRHMLSDEPDLAWVIVGGESGPNARPMHPDWARSLRDQCAAAGVAFFMKQMSGPVKAKMPPIPDDIMIREMPHAR